MTTATKYFSMNQRLRRILLAIAGFYILYNPTGLDLVNGTWRLVSAMGSLEPFWYWIIIAVWGLGLASYAIFAFRRVRLAVRQANLLLLGLRTMAVAGIIVVVSLIAARLLGYPWESVMLTTAKWTWQIVAGFFVGTGLSWAIVDRKIAGVYATDETDEVD